MATLLLITALFLQIPEPAPAAATIAGRVMPPEGVTFDQPVAVVLLSQEYAGIWNADVQRRLDNYWERNKPVLAQRKELFFDLAARAYREGLQHIITLIRRDRGLDASTFIKQTASNGSFQFENMPASEYVLIAVGSAGGRDFMWQEIVDFDASAPAYVQVKTLIP